MIRYQIFPYVHMFFFYTLSQYIIGRQIITSSEFHIYKMIITRVAALWKKPIGNIFFVN